MSENSTTSTSTGPSRRTVVRTAAWAAPAVSIVTAAPAFAASPATDWTVTSTSWEGFGGGGRGQTSTYYMRFAITAPTSAPLSSVTAVAAFGLNDQGNQISAPYTTGSLTGWSRTPASPVLSSPTWTYTRGPLSGTTTLELTYHSLLFTGAGSIGTFTFTAPGQQPVVFNILKQNAGPNPGFITNPPA